MNTLKQSPEQETSSLPSKPTTRTRAPRKVSRRKELAQEELPQSAVFAVLNTILPVSQARALAGYADKSSRGRIDVSRYSMTVGEIRDKLADIPGLVSYMDQIAELIQMKASAKTVGDNATVLASIKEINKMQGYIAPLKMEIENKIKISGAVLELKAIIGKTGIGPADIRAELERRKEAKLLARDAAAELARPAREIAYVPVENKSVELPHGANYNKIES